MNEKQNLGWKVPTDVADSFKQHCDSTGSNYQDTLAAAMVIWPYLPPSVQRQAQLEAKGVPAVDKKFWAAFSQGLEDAILGLARNRHRKGQKK